MNARGVTLVEVMVYCGIAAWIGMSVFKYVKLPTHLNQMMRTMSTEQAGYGATSMPIDDLKCAISTSIQWKLIDPSQDNPPYNPSANSQFIPWFQINDPTLAPSDLPISYVCYRYRSSDGALLREFIPGGPPTASPIDVCEPVADDHAQQTVVAKGLLPPTAAMPLFTKDPVATNMVVINLRIKTGNNKEGVIVRRVHIRS